ncbi:hypothetical protein IGS68_24870 [Skermanella sp. TT6]|uniref:Uncharacterized protein n=1 Tax=Skermanella cutis TaxID=2775420 RepID=A0ABX7B4W1_9PROT|nr:hypothetical protein [Skermanella sp. TT6]QQP89187.1 hypothetical protein IGS68_24870 [Skermanella sp. TT6]
MISAIFALLCGGAVFAYLYNVCDCGFQQSQWIFVIGASVAVALAVWLLGLIAGAIGRRLAGRRSA